MISRPNMTYHTVKLGLMWLSKGTVKYGLIRQMVTIDWLIDWLIGGHLKYRVNWYEMHSEGKFALAPLHLILNTLLPFDTN